MLDTESRHGSVLDQGPSSRDPWLTTMDWTLGTDQSLQDMLDCDIKSEIDSVIGGHPELGFNFTELSPLELDDDPVGCHSDLNGWFGSQSLLNGNSNSSNSVDPRRAESACTACTTTTDSRVGPKPCWSEEWGWKETRRTNDLRSSVVAAPPSQAASRVLSSKPASAHSCVKMVELSRQDYRVAVFYDFKRGLSPAESHLVQCATWGQKLAPTRTLIESFYREFEDSGWMKEPRGVEVATLHRLLRYDPGLSYREIKRHLGLERDEAEAVLKTLRLQRNCGQWVPLELSEAQRHARLDWCRFMLEKFEKGKSREVAKILSSTEAWLYQHTEGSRTYWSFEDEGKSRGQRRMLLCFFSSGGHVATASLINRRSVTAEAYIDDCLSHVLINWRALQPKGRLYLHHDDAPVHVAARTLDYLSGKEIGNLPHPPCSPDLRLEDKRLAPSYRLKGERYDSEEQAARAYANSMDSINSKIWSALFSRWFKRMRSCLTAQGDYVNKANFNLDLNGCDAASIMVNPNSVMPHMSVRSPTTNNNASSTSNNATSTTASSTTTSNGTAKRHFAFSPKLEPKEERGSRSELLTVREQELLPEQNGDGAASLVDGLDDADPENEAESDAERDYDNDATASSEEEDESEDEEPTSQQSSISSPGTLKLSLHPNNKSKAAFLLPASTIKTLSPQLLKAHQQQQALKVNGITGIRLQNLKILQSPGQVQQIRRQIYNNNVQLVTTQQQATAAAAQHQQLLQQQQTQSHITQLAASTTSNNCPKRDKELDPLGHDYDDKPYPKPAYSYSCLIAMALKNSQTGSLPVSEIYNFMCEHFPYFKTAPNGWKNSVRHNLSLNKCFEKIEKPAGNGNQRKGCLWAINPAKIAKMDEEVQKWSRKDPLAIKKAMIYPEQLELLERGEMKYVGSGSGDLSEETESSADEAEGPEEAAQPHHAGLGGLGGGAAGGGHLAANSVTDSYDESSQDDCDVDVSEQLYDEIDIDEENKDALHMQLNISSAKDDSGLDYQLSPSTKRQKTLTGTLQANYVYQPVTTARRKTSSLFLTTGAAAGSFLKIE